MKPSTRKMPRRGREPLYIPRIIPEAGKPEDLVGFLFDKEQDALDAAQTEIDRRKKEGGPR